MQANLSRDALSKTLEPKEHKPASPKGAKRKPDVSDPLHVLSLGAGVQSSTIALMAAAGEITPMPHAAVFADTQAEPAHVYTWLDWLEQQLPFPVYRVTRGNLRDDITNAASLPRFASPPFFTTNLTGREGVLWRQCTREYKVEPITKKLRELAGYAPRKHIKHLAIIQWIGISTDEIQRMKYNKERWIDNRFPLIELNMTRLHCLEWLLEHGYNDLPRKSACTFCPYHDNRTWREMRDNDYLSWTDALEVDLTIRDGLGTEQQLYLHRSLIPLRDADLTDPAEHQNSFSFMDECEGLCGN